MTKPLKFGVALSLVLAALPAAAEDPAPATRWRDAAEGDLAAIRAELNRSSPAPFAGEAGATFRDWLDKGYAEAERALPKVTDAKSYHFLLKGYVGGFRDSHVYVRPTAGFATSDELLRPLTWPGFGVGWRNGIYRVTSGRAGAPESHPPVGASLLSCDGVAADDLARARLDRYQGNLDLVTDRYRTADYLLVDIGNPFVPAPPESCLFEIGGRSARYSLTYAAPEDEQFRAAQLVSVPPVQAPLSLTRVEPGVYWLRIASLNNNQDWSTFLREAEAARDAIRSAPLVVVDVRGNSGGVSSYAYRLARIIWGEELVAQRAPAQGDSIWRVSPANRDWLLYVIGMLAKDRESAGDLAYYRQLLAMMDSARAGGKPTFVYSNSEADAAESHPQNPVRGKVVLLTDYSCNSACLDLMDLYLKLPNTVQAGTETYADTIFMEETRVPLPSGKMTLVFGHKAIMGRERKSNQTYRPSPEYRFTGNFAADSEVRSWVLETFLQGRSENAADSGQNPSANR